MSILLILLLSLFLFYYFQAPVHHDKFLVLGKKVNFNYESNSDWGIALKTECKLAGKCEEEGFIFGEVLHTSPERSLSFSLED